MATITNPTCVTDNQLQDEAGRIGEMISAKLLAKSPWNRLMMNSQEAFPVEMGQTIQTLLYERTKIPDVTSAAWSDVGYNDGSGNNCNPTPQDIQFARTLKSYNLQQAAVKSPSLCVNDLRYGWETSKQLSEQYRILAMNTAWFWENRYRDEYLRLSGNHVVFDSTDPEACTTTGSNEDFAASPAQYSLSQSYLDAYYLDLARDSAEGAYGMVNGMDQYLLITSPENINNLRQQNAPIREDIRFSGEANDLLAPLGASWTYKNYYMLADLQCPRYNFVGGQYVRVPYYINTPATTGNKAIVNPAYKTAAFEVSFIFNPHVYTSRVTSKITSPGGNTSFDAVNYRGDFIWMNIRDNTCNILGDTGYFYALYMQGSEPLRTEWGFSLLTQRCSTPNTSYSCS